MPATIKQIAAAAGVSRGTVDRVLLSRSGVTPGIAVHVRQIAKDLGYEPNRAGKILAARKQPLKIGCFLPGIGNAFYEDVVAGFRQAEAEYADFGVTVELSRVAGYDVQTHIQAIQGLVDAGCQALCVSTVDTHEIRSFLNRLIESGIPVITVNTDLTGTKRLCYVGSDYLRGGSVAAGLLTMMNPSRLNLLIVTGSLKIKGHNERIRGFSRTLREKKVPYKLVDVFESLDNDEYAYQPTMKVLCDHPDINCIYIVAAGGAGVCRAVTELGRQNRIYVLSYDEIETTRQLVRDGVIDFTIGQEPVEQGRCSIQLMFDYYMSGKRVIPQDHITDTVIKIKENID